LLRPLILIVLSLLLYGLALGSSAHAASAGGNAGTGGITELAYATQPDSSLYVSGKYLGKPVNMVRSGALGVGKWVLYAGAVNDRVRLTFDDKNGLQEILAMDKGQRMTLNTVGQERIEYRLYAPDRSFIIGSVLYRKDARWLQGIMRSEVFAGYAALTDVSDVTATLGAHSASAASDVLAWMQNKWRNASFISTAYAQTGDDLVRGFFSPSAQDARGFFGAPLNEMWKGALVGASAFTVKLAGQMIAAGETATVGSALVAAAPFLVAVGSGVVIGLAAERAYNWVEAKNLGGSASARDAYNRLVAGTRFSREAPPKVPSQASASASTQVGAELQWPQLTQTPPRSAPSGSSPMSLIDMADKLDKLDRQDMGTALDAADQCTNRRDFNCTNAQLDKAAKFASSAQDKLALDASRQKMANEKSRMADEERQRVAQERQRADEQQRDQQRVAQAQRQGGFQWGKALALTGGALIGGIDKLGGEQQLNMLTGIAQDSQAGQTGISNTQAGIDSLRPAPSASPSSRNQGSSGVSPVANQSASNATCLKAGEVVVSDANVPPHCAKGRQNAFGWGKTKDAACRGAQNEVRDGFGGTNPSGCYCKANSTVNTVVQPFVCWIIFD
jgi:hypothetical protein